jgi:type I restriction enzyme S subunit
VSGGLNPVFLSYQLRSSTLKAWLLQHAEGSTMASLNQKILGRLPLVIPDAPVQERIAAVLSAIDSRIDLARESNRTLEAMARAMFKSWFVDFDPVRAKAEGREPEGMDAATAALFPSEFQDSKLGPIPRGWNVANVGDLCTRVSMGPFGSNIKTENFVPTGVPVIRGGNLKAGFLDEDFVYVTEAKASELRNSVAYPGDIVITHRGTLGQVGLIPLNSCFDRYVVSQSQMLLSVDKASASPIALYLFLTSLDGQQRLLANANQTGVPAIARPTASVKAIKTIVPSHGGVLASFDQLANALFERVTANDYLVRTLSSLRDTLLPRLISGKLRVPETESILAEVV